MLALREVKSESTRKLLSQVMVSIENYHQANGRLPDFQDYISLTDVLSPTYMVPLIRLDSWRNPLSISRSGPGSVELRSAGPDGKLGTEDDIKLAGTFPPRP
jgi:hypothetical protein